MIVAIALALQVANGAGRPAVESWAVRMARSAMIRDSSRHASWDYAWGIELLGIQRVAARTRNPELARYVKASVDRLVNASGDIAGYRMDEHNLDQISEGRLLFPLWQSSRDSRYRTAIMTLRNQLRAQPRTSDGGFWHKDIYPHQMWLDGLYMAEPFYAQYAAVFHEPAVFDDVAKQFLLMRTHAIDSTTGLLYHGWDESHQQPWADSARGTSPSFWARAIGWYMMGLVDALDFIPATHRDRPALVRTFQELARSVKGYQDDFGLWYDVIDQGERKGNYRETSASAMFAYAFAKGARMGYLDQSYRAAATKAFDRLSRSALAVGSDGTLTLGGIVSVSGLGGPTHRNGTYAYYIGEPVVSDDPKGVGAFILAADELGR